MARALREEIFFWGGGGVPLQIDKKCVGVRLSHRRNPVFCLLIILYFYNQLIFSLLFRLAQEKQLANIDKYFFSTCNVHHKKPFGERKHINWESRCSRAK